MELLIAVGFFGLITALVYFVIAAKAPVSDDAIQRRLESIGLQTESRAQIRLQDTEETTFWERVANFFFGDRELPERFNLASKRLHQAGYRGNRAVRIFWGLRIFLAIARRAAPSNNDEKRVPAGFGGTAGTSKGLTQHGQAA